MKIALIKEKLCKIFWRTFFYVLSVDAILRHKFLLTSRHGVLKKDYSEGALIWAGAANRAGALNWSFTVFNFFKVSDFGKV